MKLDWRGACLGTTTAAASAALAIGVVRADFLLLGGAAIALGYGILRLCLTQHRARRGACGAPLPQAANAEAFDPTDSGALVDQMLEEGRYALLLRPELTPNLNPDQFQRAWDSLHESMALVPEGDVVVGQGGPWDEEGTEVAGFAVRVEAFYLDRYAVSNRQYQQFVDAGGYEQLGLWDPEILPGLMDFVDSSGQPGPRGWRHGSYPPGQADHPVVGLSWYEATAFARWVGKRLATDPEWEKAASWPAQMSASARAQRRYPWGDVMDRGRANLWGSGPKTIVPVDHFAEGSSVGGIIQMVGNVWEWTSGSFGTWSLARSELLLPVEMKSIRGGAFDTYFDNQSTCQFQSGEDPLARRHNIGFRCALSACDLDWPRDYPSDQAQNEPETAEAPQASVCDQELLTELPLGEHAHLVEEVLPS